MMIMMIIINLMIKIIIYYEEWSRKIIVSLLGAQVKPGKCEVG